MNTDKYITTHDVASTLDKLNSLLDNNPDDFTVRSLLADFYCDCGDYEAEDCLRWQVSERKRPLNYGEWQWYDEDRPSFSGEDVESDLPKILFDHLLDMLNSRICVASYRSRREAEDDLLAAWRVIGGIK